VEATKLPRRSVRFTRLTAPRRMRGSGKFNRHLPRGIAMLWQAPRWAVRIAMKVMIAQDPRHRYLRLLSVEKHSSDAYQLTQSKLERDAPRSPDMPEVAGSRPRRSIKRIRRGRALRKATRRPARERRSCSPRPRNWRPSAIMLPRAIPNFDFDERCSSFAIVLGRSASS